MTNKTSVDLLEMLSNAFGPSGFEEEVSNIIKLQIEPLVDEMKIDKLGNLIAQKKGADPNGSILMLDAHTDEIGLMITSIDSQGYLYFSTIGGWDPRILPAQHLQIQTKDGKYRTGVIGVNPPHITKDRNKPFPISALFIDVGATTKNEVEEMGLKIGCVATITRKFEQLTDTRVLGKAFDDRAGCALLIRVLQNLSDMEHDATIVANFAVQEEVGGRGATVAAFDIDPDYALALEGTVGADTPDVPEHLMPTKTGGGPSITIMDNSLISSPKIVKLLETVAKELQIQIQYRKPIGGGTDAGRIHQVRSGIPASVVSVPCRYIHSPISILDLQDFENAVKLVTGFCKKI